MRLTHRKCTSFFKGILGIVGVILFMAQLSYKFYQCASVPLKGSQEYFPVHGQAAAHSVSFSNDDGQDRCLLSLDKRYDLKHIYYLPGSIFCLAPLPLAGFSEVYFLSPRAVSRPNLLSSLRAPPSIGL